MRSALSLAVFLAVASVSQADWSQPCFNHTCTYHLPKDGPAEGTLTLRGPPGTISDITPAAGWEILDCDKDKLEQKIRIVCMDRNGCDHLHSHGGPEGKIVRLPESCGRMAFALIKRSWIHDDQSIPHHISRRLNRRQAPPIVLGKHITPEIASEATKDVIFEAIGTTTQAKKGVYSASNGEHGQATIHSANQPGAASAVGGTFPNITNSTHQARDISIPLNENVTDATLAEVGAFSKKLFGLDEKNLDKVVPIKIRLPETTIASVVADCGTSKVRTNFSAHADGDVVAMVGVHMRGSLNGSMEKAETYIQMKGNLVGAATLDANLNGYFGPFEARVLQQPLNSIEFGWVFSVTPIFDVVTIFEGELNLNGQVTYNFDYTMNDFRVSFPLEKGRSNFTISTGQSPLKLKIDQAIKASGDTLVHIVPRVTVNYGFPSFLHTSMFVAADIGIATSFGNLPRQIPREPIRPDVSPQEISALGDEVKLEPALDVNENDSESKFAKVNSMGEHVEARSDNSIAVPVPPLEKYSSLLTVLPNLRTVFEDLSTERDPNACFFAQPSLKVFSGAVANAGFVNVITLLGFDERDPSIISTTDLYTAKFNSSNVLNGDPRCPFTSLPSVEMTTRSIESATGTCATLTKTVDHDEVMKSIQIALPNGQEAATVNPKIGAGNS